MQTVQGELFLPFDTLKFICGNQNEIWQDLGPSLAQSIFFFMSFQGDVLVGGSIQG